MEKLYKDRKTCLSYYFTENVASAKFLLLQFAEGKVFFHKFVSTKSVDWVHIW